MRHFNLASERIRLGMNQTQLGERLGYGVKTISKWEKDISSMPGKAVRDAANIFGCSVDYLLDETDDRLVRTPREVM